MTEGITPGAYIPAGTPPPKPGTDARSRAIYWGSLGVFALAILGAIAGVFVLWLHLTTDPLSDVRAYYDAAHRLNTGAPLYPPTADPNAPDFFRYPPLLAIVLRPLALMPYSLFAILWEVVLLAVLVATVRRLGGGRWVWLAIGLLGIPIGWAIAIGQAQILVTYLMAVGQPWAIAAGGQLKLFPALIAIWWLGRRDWQAFGAFVAYTLILVLLQFVLEPTGTKAFLGTLTFDQVGEVRNVSPFAFSPALWAALAAAGAVAVVLLAPTRWGWPAAVTLSSLASPRLLVYMLMSLLAAVHEPATPVGDTPERRDPPPDAAEAYVASAR